MLEKELKNRYGTTDFTVEEDILLTFAIGGMLHKLRTVKFERDCDDTVLAEGVLHILTKMALKSMWYRFSRREDDYCIECSTNGEHFSHMRICHMWQGGGTIRFGIYARSSEDASFKAIFTNMAMTEYKWLAHDGQKPDEEA